MRALLLAVVTFVCGFASAAEVVHGSSDAAQVADPDPSRFENDILAFEDWDRKNAHAHGAVLFVGSSSIRMWPTAESFAGLPVINRGFGGSHISDVNYFAERIVLKYKPQTIVFYAGDNDIEAGKPPQQVFNDFQAFATLVHQRLPETRIVYLPIKPSIARWSKWRQMQAVNSRVDRLAQNDTRIVYVDTATPMLDDDGKPRGELFLDDGLHLNGAGYKEWTEILAPELMPAAKPLLRR
jgi:lysophospholipase L1-like esterase